MLGRPELTHSLHPDLSYISYEEFLADVHRIMAAVRQDDWTPDFVVGIGRGGLAPAVFISHGMKIPLLSVDHSSRIADFADELLAKLARLTGRGTRLLFIDDINDSGSTLLYIRNELDGQGAERENIRFAALINNIRSQADVRYWSREIDRASDKRWFVFPWEAMATAETLISEANEIPERLA